MKKYTEYINESKESTICKNFIQFSTEEEQKEFLDFLLQMPEIKNNKQIKDVISVLNEDYSFLYDSPLSILAMIAIFTGAFTVGLSEFYKNKAISILAGEYNITDQVKLEKLALKASAAKMKAIKSGSSVSMPEIIKNIMS